MLFESLSLYKLLFTHMHNGIDYRSILLSQRSVLSSVCECDPGHAGYDQRDMVTWPWSSLLYHLTDILKGTR